MNIMVIAKPVIIMLYLPFHLLLKVLRRFFSTRLTLVPVTPQTTCVYAPPAKIFDIKITKFFNYALLLDGILSCF